jgi:4-hydroxy-2-oxoheptanedioate aldolase
VVEATRYPPGGIRGVGSALSRSARWNRVDGYLPDAQEHVSLFVQVENIQGVEAAADIAAVDGIDGVFVGPSDLSASMGLLGQQSHPDVVAAVHQVFDAVRAAGKPVGVNAFDQEVARGYIAAGASFLLVGADVSILARGSEALAAAFVPKAGEDDRASY